jgi:hypothetical protein
MTFIIVALSIVAVLAVYLAILATWTVAHDLTLPVAGRALRIVAAWLIPIGGAVSILRASAELAPESLPPLALLQPLRWLLHVSPSRPNSLADEADVGAYGSPARHEGE